MSLGEKRVGEAAWGWAWQTAHWRSRIPLGQKAPDASGSAGFLGERGEASLPSCPLSVFSGSFPPWKRTSIPCLPLVASAGLEGV
jgi:hypothetical protein